MDNVYQGKVIVGEEIVHVGKLYTKPEFVIDELSENNVILAEKSGITIKAMKAIIELLRSGEKNYVIVHGVIDKMITIIADKQWIFTQGPSTKPVHEPITEAVIW